MISESFVDGVEDDHLGCQFLDVALDELEEFPLKFVSVLVLVRVPAPKDGCQVGGAGGDLAQAELGGGRCGLLGNIIVRRRQI